MPPLRPFRFGVQLRTVPDGPAWRRTVRRAEALGYSSVFLPDHLQDTWNPIVPLTVAAEATTTLRVGSLVFANDFRHPLLLARDLAALDVLSDGRVEFGLGAGWMAADYEQAGIPFDSPAVRIERLDEALTLIRRLWSEDHVRFDGRHYHLRDAACVPRPCRPGGPPVLVGGGGDRLLRVAARHADIVSIHPELRAGVVGPEAARTAVAERFHQRIAVLRDAAGDRFEQIELQLKADIDMVVPNRWELYEQVAPAFGLTAREAADVPVVLVGTVEEICDDLVKRRELYGFSYVVVHDLDGFAPVVAALAGT